MHKSVCVIKVNNTYSLGVVFHDLSYPRSELSIKQQFSQFGVAELDRPAQRSDLNPTRHLWDKLEHRL